MKDKIPMKASMKQVFILAAQDKKFLTALLKDPEKACTNAKPEKLDVSPDEMKLLKKALARKTTVTSSEMLGYINSIVHASAGSVIPGKPWPPPPPWWPKFVQPVSKPGKAAPRKAPPPEGAV
jgi:hypothetical protein